MVLGPPGHQIMYFWGKETDFCTTDWHGRPNWVNPNRYNKYQSFGNIFYTKSHDDTYVTIFQNA